MYMATSQVLHNYGGDGGNGVDNDICDAGCSGVGVHVA